MSIWRRGCRDVTVFTKNRDRLLGGAGGRAGEQSSVGVLPVDLCADTGRVHVE